MPRSTQRERQRDRKGGRKFRTQTKADRKQKVKPHTRKKYWVAGYKRRDGKRVKGHMVKNPWYRRKTRVKRKR